MPSSGKTSNMSLDNGTNMDPKITRIKVDPIRTSSHSSNHGNELNKEPPRRVNTLPRRASTLPIRANTQTRWTTTQTRRAKTQTSRVNTPPSRANTPPWARGLEPYDPPRR